MTENLPEVYAAELVAEDRYYPEVRDEHTDGWIPVLQHVSELAAQVADTEFVPAALRGKPAAIAASILAGRELDMPPMQALANMYVVEGRPTLAAEHLRAMVFAAGHEIVFVVTNSSECTVKGRRKGSSEWTTVTWNRAAAENAKLWGKKNWERYPRQMLAARASAELIRMVFPDVTHGVRSTEEAEDELTAADSAAPDSGRQRVSRAKKGADSPQAAGAVAAGAPPSPANRPAPAAARPPRAGRRRHRPRRGAGPATPGRPPGPR